MKHVAASKEDTVELVLKGSTDTAEGVILYAKHKELFLPLVNLTTFETEGKLHIWRHPIKLHHAERLALDVVENGGHFVIKDTTG